MYTEIGLPLVLIVWNLITFILMGIDKYKAVKGKWRISESTLFLCAFLLGGPGIFLGMLVFRHKTRHLSFRIFIPAAAIINLIIYYFLFERLL